MLSPEDRESFLAGFEGLSRESRYLRFFTGMPRLPDSMLRRLLNTDGTDHAALAAWHSGGADLIVKGAYTQSRLRQMIFGGMTRHLILNSPLPVLFSY